MLLSNVFTEESAQGNGVSISYFALNLGMVKTEGMSSEGNYLKHFKLQLIVNN